MIDLYPKDKDSHLRNLAVGRVSPRVEVRPYEDPVYGSVFNLAIRNEDETFTTVVKNLTPAMLAVLVAEAGQALADHVIESEASK